MVNENQSRAERFLKMYRVLEGMLEKRLDGVRQGSSVVMDYIRDPDSEPFRHELNVCREIRNLLTHNADSDGEPLVEPSEKVLNALQSILEHVSAPRYAVDYGTPQEMILWAHPNDEVMDVMHRMNKNGFSHVPVMERGRIMGVFSVGSLFVHLEKNGLDALNSGSRIKQIDEAMNLDKCSSNRYLFLPRDATIYQVRDAFEERSVRNNRLSAVFITETGEKDESLIAMLTPWDVLKNSSNMDV